MNKNEKAAHGVASTESGKTEAAAALAGSTTNSDNHDNMAAAGRQGICAYLGIGASSARTTREIARFSGYQPRVITREIQRKRASGSPICASGDGFYMAADAPELARYLKCFDRRLREMARTRRGLEVAYNSMTGQMQLDLPNNGEAD